MTDPNPQPLPSEPIGDDRVHKEPQDQEEIYFSGSPKLRGMPGKMFLHGLIALLFILAPILLWFFTVDTRLPLWASAVCWLIGIIVILIPVLKNRSIRYRVTNYRIDYERGLLSKDIDTLELWHVEDLKFHQSLLDRLLNVGTIDVISHDDANPTLFLRGLPNPRPVYEQLKQRVIAVKRQRGVLKVDPG